ncbi:MAG: hypothetical protein HOQ32_14890 [Lysobacter sp.]|nr:hypothetical protein [Lysobacter sp.]
MAQLDDHSYLWDGSDPGWVVFDVRRQVAELALRFPDGGPSLRDIAAVRAALPRFAEQTSAQAFAALKGQKRVPLGEYEYDEAKRVSAACKKRGLSVEMVGTDASALLPYHEGRKTGLIIEDDALAAAVCEAAIARGIRVLRIEA